MFHSSAAISHAGMVAVQISSFSITSSLSKLQPATESIPIVNMTLQDVMPGNLFSDLRKLDSEASAIVHPEARAGYWGQLELAAFLSSLDPGNFWNFLMPSLALFWPEAHIVAILEDRPPDRVFGDALPERYRPCYTRRYEKFPGRKRVQLLKFFVDECSNASYIGFVDSDTLFTAKVTNAALFSGSRPIVITEIGRPRSPWYEITAEPVAKFLRRSRSVSCMSQFPLVFWREHVGAMRSHLEAVHGVLPGGFEQLASELYPSDGIIIEYDVLCNFVLEEFPSWYSFHGQEITPSWRGPLLPGQSNVSETLPKVNVTPFIRTAVHGGYMGPAFSSYLGIVKTTCHSALPLGCVWRDMVVDKLHEGFCRFMNSQSALPAHMQAHVDKWMGGSKPCSHYVAETVHEDLFRFEFLDSYSWADRPARRKSCHDVQLWYYGELSKWHSSLSCLYVYKGLLEAAARVKPPFSARLVALHKYKLEAQFIRDILF